MVVLAGFELPTTAGGKDCELNIFPITRVRDAMRDHLCNGDFATVIANASRQSRQERAAVRSSSGMVGRF